MRASATFLAVLASMCLACGPGETQERTSQPAASAAPLDFAGRYEVTGVTLDKTTGTQRQIQGTVFLKPVGDGTRYTSHVEFGTLYPGTDSIAAKVVGTGEGSVVGRRLEGTASTTILVSSAPGVDTGFAYIPRLVSAQITSSSTAMFAADGTVSIEIENLPAEGELDYQPTRTLLVGYRLEEPGDS